MAESFALTLTPVLGGMICGPLLNNAAHDYRQTRTILRDLAFSEENVAQGRWWTRLTYAFVHRDEDHLGRNCLALVPFAHAVHSAFGALWLPIFAGGVLAGAHNVAGKRYQAARRLSEPYAVRLWAPSLLEPAADAVDRVTRQVASWIAPSVARTTAFVGASAGVWALQGTAMCLSIEQIVLMLTDGSLVEREHRSSEQVAAFTRAWPHVVSVCLLSAQLAGTAVSIKTGEASGVDHSGHLDGFLVGVGCYAMLRFAQAAHRRRRRLPLVRGGVLFGGR